MIFGFNIIMCISDDLAIKIMEITRTKVGKYTYDTPINNAIRGICINNAMNHYFLRLVVNASILISGKETIDIEFEKEQDLSVLDEKFKHNLSEIIGNEYASQLPPMQKWTLWTLIYGMDIEINHIGELMHVFAKTDIPETHLSPPQIKTQIEKGKIIQSIGSIYDASGNDRKLKIYPKSELLTSNNIDYRGPTDNLNCKSSNIIRLSLIHKRSDFGYAKRFLTKYEMDLGHLDSFLHPLVVINTFIKAYLDTIGNGDFYKYDVAMQIIENDMPNLHTRKMLIDLLKKINEKGTVAKARLSAIDKTKFQKDLKQLRDIGINGALIAPDSKFDHIKNPIDEIYYKCKIFSS